MDMLTDDAEPWGKQTANKKAIFDGQFSKQRHENPKGNCPELLAPAYPRRWTDPLLRGIAIGFS